MKIDLSYLQEMSGGNQSLILEMIEIFKDQVKEFTEGLETHYKKKEFEQLGALAHKAKSSISMELLAKAGKDQDKYQQIIDKFKIETLEAVNELTEVTKNLELYF